MKEQVISYSHRTVVASFKADPTLWSTFKETCAMRGVSICHVLEALMQAWIEGQKAEATVVKPVVVNLHMEHVVERPRRLVRTSEPWDLARGKRWPPDCESADDFIKSTKEVGCLNIRDFITLEKCWRCYLAKGK